jgi:hypothetical protein
VFEDKEAVYVKTVRTQAQPPRRTMSENTRDGAAGRTSTMRAASPELPRVKSENGRRRSAVAAEAAAPPVELVTDDEEAFWQAVRQAVEAFIAKQHAHARFHHEESLIARAAAGGGDGPAGQQQSVLAVERAAIRGGAGESDDRGGDRREHPLPSAPPAPPYVPWA